MSVSGKFEEPSLLIWIGLKLSSDAVGSEIPLGVNPSYLGASVFSSDDACRAFTLWEHFVDFVDNVISEFLLKDGTSVDVVEETGQFGQTKHVPVWDVGYVDRHLNWE